ncbi:MAG: translocation/assembly module TamB domain-containing protein [Bacteroidales bacterium]|nr:translocation/assembly module TamB domain-containing protein [Bacteroidales bacterium]
MLALFLTVYVIVALLNYSMVQSLVGSAASSYFSKEWGGKVKIGSMGCNPFNHLDLRNVELISPDNDTIAQAHAIRLRFKKFPFDSHGLQFSKVYIGDTRYHLKIDTNGLNLNYIIDYFKTGKPKDTTRQKAEFKVLVDDLILDNVDYRQDLKDKDPEWYLHQHPGVNVKHMEYNNIHGRFRNVRVDKDFVTCRIDKLTTTEKSGLEVRDLHMNVYVCRSGISATNMVVQTADSRLDGDVLLDFRHWHTMKHFLDSVYFTVHFNEGSYGNLRDAGFWTQALWGMDERVALEGDFGGPISDFHADNVRIAFGNESKVCLDASIYGLPHIDTTVIGADIHSLHTTYEDLAAVKHPNGITMKVPKIIKTLDKIDLEATFMGTIYDFYATLDMESAPGDLQADMMLSMNPKRKEYSYVGQLRSNDMRIGQLARNEWVSRGGFDITFEGEGFDPKTMNAVAEGRVKHLILKGNRLSGDASLNVDVADGLAKADLVLDDPLADINAHGEVEWRPNGPAYTVEADAKHLDMKRLALWNDTADKEAFINAHIDGRYINLRENSTFARVTLRDVYLNTTTRRCRIDNATLSAREQNHWKTLKLTSDIVDAQMQGYYRYDGIPVMLKKFVEDYFPNTHKPSDIYGKDKEAEFDKIADSRFEFNATWKDTAGLIALFVPQLLVAQGTSVQANYSFVESFKPLLRSDSIGWGGLRFYNVGVNGETMADHYRLRLTSDEIKIGSILLSENADVNLESSRDDARCEVYWENSSQTVGGGDVALRVMSDSSSLRLIVDPSRLALGGHNWSLMDYGEDIYINDKGFNVGNLSLIDGQSAVSLKASRMGNPNDSIEVSFVDFDVDIANPFLGVAGMSAGGIANGKARLGFLQPKLLPDSKGDSEVPYLNADLKIDNLMFNNVSLGDADVQSTWNSDLNQLNLFVKSYLDTNGVVNEPLSIDGYVALGSQDPQLDFTIDVNSVDLHAIQPFVSSFSSNVSGLASSDIKVGGTVSNPLLQGKLHLQEATVLVDFLNVAYTITDSLEVDSTNIWFDKVIVSDMRGDKAVVDGAISHKGFKDWRFDLSLVSDRLLCMNTSAQSSDVYYGTIFAAVNGQVRGPSDDIDILLKARTLDGTMLTVPINDKRQMRQADYIHFVSDHDDYNIDDVQVVASVEEDKINLREDKKSNFLLTIDLEATPELEMVIPVSFSTLDVNVETRGSGDLQLQVGSSKPFALLGDYEISNGNVGLDILGLISKDFDVEESSSITFPGSIGDARFDINALYSQRVNLSTLTGSLSGNESQKPIQVENVIALSGTLQSPDIKFDIRLPNADQSVQEEVFSYIDRTNERDMLNQTVSLLISKRFYSASAMNINEQTSPADGAYGLVANTLGSMVSDMVQFVDINFDYQAGTALTTDQYAVDISKEWNKFYFETTLGFGGEARELSEVGGSNNMTGDMLVGYKINPRLHLFVFNRSNTNDYTRSDLPYKQGLGLKYTRDFDRLSDIFVRKRKKQ